MESGILDDLSFEDLEKAFRNVSGNSETNQVLKPSLTTEIKPIIHKRYAERCRFNDYRPCNDLCRYYATCVQGRTIIPKSPEDEEELDALTWYRDYFEWLRKERFLERVIDLYKEFATEDKELCGISDDNELMVYLTQCEKDFKGQKRNFYKYYHQYLKQQKKVNSSK